MLADVRRLLRVDIKHELVGIAHEGSVVAGEEVVVEGARGEGEVAAAVQVPLPRHVRHHYGCAVRRPVAVHQLDGVAPAVPHRPRVLRREPAGTSSIQFIFYYFSVGELDMTEALEYGRQSTPY